ncbi:MAG: sigma-54-dependent transcriptional regulator [Desulfococcaceae bacterium]
MGAVLIVDDDKLLREALSEHVSDLGHEVLAAASLQEGEALARTEPVDVVFLDVRLPDGDGLEAVPVFQKSPASPQVIIITGVGDPDGAAMAIRHGVWDYLQKPFSTEQIERHIRRVIEYRQRRGPSCESAALKRERIIGGSPGLMECLEQVARCAASNGSVLVTGEPGTGKELFARAIHANGLRSDRRFVTVDCENIPEELMETLLFGHAPGLEGYPGGGKDGLLRQADGGTLFLDEVAELSLEIQKRLLTVLQEQNPRPVGARRDGESEFRLIASTRQHLWQMADQGRFRKDLLLRLQAFHIEIPPLRERSEDILELAQYFVHHLTEKKGGPPKSLSQEIIEVICGYEWPGNVGELIRALESAMEAAERDAVLFPVHLPEAIRLRHVRRSVIRKQSESRPDGYPSLPASAQLARSMSTFREAREATLLAMEESYLRRLAAETKGDVARMGEIADLGKSRLYSLLKKHGISLS